MIVTKIISSPHLINNKPEHPLRSYTIFGTSNQTRSVCDKDGLREKQGHSVIMSRNRWQREHYSIPTWLGIIVSDCCLLTNKTFSLIPPPRLKFLKRPIIELGLLPDSACGRQNSGPPKTCYSNSGTCESIILCGKGESRLLIHWL